MSTENRAFDPQGTTNYLQEYKRRIAMAAYKSDVSVAELAQVHGLSRNMVFKWRRQCRAGPPSKIKGEKTVLLPVVVMHRMLRPHEIEFTHAPEDTSTTRGLSLLKRF